MLIQLPLETWIEILDWLERRDLLKKLDKLWDREFTPILQDWLHKYTRNVKLGWLWATVDDGLSVRVGNHFEKVPFADVELPVNIASFERIDIKDLDSNLLVFLCRMRPLFHKNNNIHLVAERYGNQEPPNPTALRHLMPLFGSIEAISLGCNFLQFFSTNYPAILINAKLLEHWMSQASNEREQILVDWLFTKRADGHARTLILWLRNHEISCLSLYEKIRQRFLDPARQFACSPFFVRIGICDEGLPNAMEIENGRTGEQLTLKRIEYRGWHYKLITNCCPINTNVEWLNKKATEVSEWSVYKQQQVIVLESLELSPQLHANAEDDGANQQHQQHASGSGKKLI